MPRCFSICVWIYLFGFFKEKSLQGNIIFSYLYVVRFSFTSNIFYYSEIVIFLKKSFILFFENIGSSLSFTQTAAPFFMVVHLWIIARIITSVVSRWYLIHSSRDHRFGIMHQELVNAHCLDNRFSFVS